ncbi:hypothetical protein Tco_0213451 [Tanacetum coccineum]
MSNHPIYQDNMVTESHRVHYRWEPEHPWDVDPESKNDEMFSITYKLTHHLMLHLTSFKCHFSITKIEPTLIELDEVMCKAEDDLQIIARDKTNKRGAEDKENGEHVTGRNERFFYERIMKIERERWEEGMPSCDDCSTTSSSKNDEPQASFRGWIFFAEDEPEVSSRGFF